MHKKSPFGLILQNGNDNRTCSFSGYIATSDYFEGTLGVIGADSAFICIPVSFLDFLSSLILRSLSLVCTLSTCLFAIFNILSIPDEASLSFVDLEKLGTNDAANSTRGSSPSKERLIIFLENAYSAGVSNEVSANINTMFVELMAKKAETMGAMLVLSNCYSAMAKANYVRTNFHVYISKSKAGAQYLDSLNGSATVSDEGGYRTNNFYIHKDSVA